MLRPTQLADALSRHRGVVAGLVIALTILAAIGVSRLEFDDVPRSVFRTEDERFEQLEQLFQDFGSDDNECLILLEGDDLFTPAAAEGFRRLVTAVRQVPRVESVRSLADAIYFADGIVPQPLLPRADAGPEAFARARRAALAHPLIRQQVLSDDARAALAVVRIDASLLAVHDIEPVVMAVRSAAKAALEGSGLRLRITGVPSIRVEIFNAVRREANKFILIGAVLGFGMAVFLFRQFWAALIVASAPIMGSFWTLGMVGLIGEKINVINTILPTLVLVVGFADSMHLMIDIRHNRAAGHARGEASRLALRHLLVACLLTSSTTAVGFASLWLAEVSIIRRFGMVCAAGSMLSFLSTILLVPLLASTRLGEHLDINENRDFIARYFHWFERAIDWLAAHAWGVTIGSVAVTLLLATSMFYLVPDNRLVETIPRSNESYQAIRDIDRVLGGSLTAFVVVEWPQELRLASPQVLSTLRKVHELIGQQAGLHAPASILSVLQSLPGAGTDLAPRVAMLPAAPADVVQRYLRSDLRRALVTFRMADRGSAYHQPAFTRIRQGLAELERREAAALRLELTGSVVVASENINKMIRSLNQSLFGAAVVIFGSIAIGFRSIRWAAISVLPNVFPLVAVATLIVYTGQSLQLTSVIVFSVCLGIAVDDTIHFLNRFQRELAIDQDVPAAIRRAFLAVGSAVITTTIVLLTGFGSVMTSEMPSSQLFGQLSCAAYLTAIIGDMVMLPALLICFVRGKRAATAQLAPSTESAVGA